MSSGYSIEATGTNLGRKSLILSAAVVIVMNKADTTKYSYSITPKSNSVSSP